VRLGLSDAGSLLHRRALPHLACLAHDLVELLPAGPGAEHIAHANSCNEHQFAAHCASFLAVRSILPLLGGVVTRYPGKRPENPVAMPARPSCTLVAAEERFGRRAVPRSSIGRATGC